MQVINSSVIRFLYTAIMREKLSFLQEKIQAYRDEITYQCTQLVNNRAGYFSTGLWVASLLIGQSTTEVQRRKKKRIGPEKSHADTAS